MDRKYMEKTIEKDILPDLGEFLQSESAFMIYVKYDNKKSGVKTLVIPSPPIENVEEVMQEVADKVFEQTHKLPELVFACERIRYLAVDEMIEVDNVDMNNTEEGLIVVALEASSAKGFAKLYSLPDLEELSTRDFDKESDDAPPYTLLAIASFMHESLEQFGLIDKTEKEKTTDVQFKFSRN